MDNRRLFYCWKGCVNKKMGRAFKLLWHKFSKAAFCNGKMCFVGIEPQVALRGFAIANIARAAGLGLG